MPRLSKCVGPKIVQLAKIKVGVTVVLGPKWGVRTDLLVVNKQKLGWSMLPQRDCDG